MQDLHVARSWLFVPGDRPDRFEKASRYLPDQIILDLEDAVAPDQKSTALRHVLHWIDAGRPAVVRVNASRTPWHAREILELGRRDVPIMLPKAEPVEVAAAMDTLGATARVVALVETPRGVSQVSDICALPGVVRLALGNVDLGVELGVDPGSHAALHHTRASLVLAAAAAGMPAPIDGVTTALRSAEILAADLAMARELGFTGKLCIHPDQVGAVNQAFVPSEDELTWAQHILHASAPGSSVSAVDGSMVDEPVVRRAQTILKRARPQA